MSNRAPDRRRQQGRSPAVYTGYNTPPSSSQPRHPDPPPHPMQQPHQPPNADRRIPLFPELAEPQPDLSAYGLPPLPPGFGNLYRAIHAKAARSFTPETLAWLQDNYQGLSAVSARQSRYRPIPADKCEVIRLAEAFARALAIRPAISPPPDAYQVPLISLLHQISSVMVHAILGAARLERETNPNFLLPWFWQQFGSGPAPPPMSYGLNQNYNLQAGFSQQLVGSSSSSSAPVPQPTSHWALPIGPVQIYNSHHLVGSSSGLLRLPTSHGALSIGQNQNYYSQQLAGSSSSSSGLLPPPGSHRVSPITGINQETYSVERLRAINYNVVAELQRCIRDLNNDTTPPLMAVENTRPIRPTPIRLLGKRRRDGESPDRRQHYLASR